MGWAKLLLLSRRNGLRQLNFEQAAESESYDSFITTALHGISISLFTGGTLVLEEIVACHSRYLFCSLDWLSSDLVHKILAV